MSKFKEYSPLFAILIFCSIYFFFQLPLLTVDGFDELIYYRFSLAPMSTWSPLYSSFYRLLELYIPWFSTPYVVFFIVSIFLYPVAIYLLSFRLTSNKIFSSVITLLLFFTHNNLGSTTRVHLFNFSVLTLLYLYCYQKEFAPKKILWALILGLSVHIRMENLVFAVTFLGLELFNKKDYKFIPVYLIVLGAGLFIPQWHDGNALTTPNTRTFLAFRDHFIWENPEKFPDNKSFYQSFSKANSLGSFIVYYPLDFGIQFAKNVFNTPKVTIESIRPWKTNIPIYFLLIPFLAFGAIFAKIKFNPESSFRIFLLAMLAQALALNWSMHTWERYSHYFVFITLLFLVYIFPKTLTSLRRSFVVILALFLVFGAVTPREERDLQINTLEDWESIDSIDFKKIILPNLYPLIVRPDLRIKSEFIQPFVHIPLAKVIEEFEINVICTHNDPSDFLYHHPDGTQFINDPAAFGFAPMPVGIILRCYKKL